MSPGCRLSQCGLRIIEERKGGRRVSRRHLYLIAFVWKQNSANQQSAEEGGNKRQSPAPAARRRTGTNSPQLLVQEFLVALVHGHLWHLSIDIIPLRCVQFRSNEHVEFNYASRIDG